MVKQPDDNGPVRYGEPGYGPSGESLWSRSAAKGGNVDSKTADHAPPLQRAEWSRLDVMVQHERKEVEKILRSIARAKVEDPQRVPFKIKRLQRTRFLLARLEKE